MSDRAQRIAAHLRSSWGQERERLHPAGGRSAELPADFEVLVFQHRQGLLAYSTCCMSVESDREALELFIVAQEGLGPEGVGFIVDDLAAVAHYHRTGTPLGLAHTVNLGRPWLPGAGASHAVLCLPYLDGPKLEWMQAPRTRFLWLLPILPAELAFKKENGLEALEQRFDAARFDFADPLRASVV